MLSLFFHPHQLVQGKMLRKCFQTVKNQKGDYMSQEDHG